MPAFLRKTQDKLLNVNSSKKGFTLVELLVAISVIAILSTIGFTVFQDARTKALAAKAKADVDSIRKAYEQNFDPSANGGQGGYKRLSPAGDGNSPYFSGGKIPTPQGGGSYIVSGPDVDPTNTGTYVISSDKNTGQACLVCGGNCSCVTSTGGTPASTSSGSSGGSCVVAGSELDSITSSINRGLVGYWPMDESSWTKDCAALSVNDYSTGVAVPSLKVCPSGTAVDQTTDGKSSKGALFPTNASVNSYIGFNDNLRKYSFSSGNFTITAWIKIASTGTICGNVGGTACSIVSRNTGQYTGYIFQATAVSGVSTLPRLWLGLADWSQGIYGSTGLSRDAWHHVAVTVDTINLAGTGRVKLYVDGNLESPIRVAPVNPFCTSANGSYSDGAAPFNNCVINNKLGGQADLIFAIGSSYQGGSNVFRGTIDDVRVYNRVLSPSEIQQVMNNPYPPCQ